ncbi:MAG: hypothetical protein QOK40_2835, partial [Miltoncostaeaceae bacterium]|nr:hypothetical protein [Miltoncostaeaceae bacterium]
MLARSAVDEASHHRVPVVMAVAGPMAIRRP